MPLYEYACDDCGVRFERIRKFSDPPLTVCPECGGTVQKLISSPAIQFKGSGWYITDYARAGQKSDSGDSSAAPKEGSAKDGGPAGSTGGGKDSTTKDTSSDGAGARTAASGDTSKGGDSSAGTGSSGASDSAAAKPAATTSSKG